MLPFCDRIVSVLRKDVAPVWTRSFPIAKEPTTLGQHLNLIDPGSRRVELKEVVADGGSFLASIYSTPCGQPNSARFGFLSVKEFFRNDYITTKWGIDLSWL